jgi:hypothetical protein
MPTGLRRPCQSPSPWQAAHREVSGLDISCIIVQYPSSSRYLYIYILWIGCMCGDVWYADVCRKKHFIYCTKTSYWCLAGNGWEWGNGIIINSDYGSFPHSLLSTSKYCTKTCFHVPFSRILPSCPIVTCLNHPGCPTNRLRQHRLAHGEFQANEAAARQFVQMMGFW